MIVWAERRRCGNLALSAVAALALLVGCGSHPLSNESRGSDASVALDAGSTSQPAASDAAPAADWIGSGPLIKGSAPEEDATDCFAPCPCNAVSAYPKTCYPPFTHFSCPVCLAAVDAGALD
jgi:hypothetical protein